jgi:hypothetical protein
MSLLSIVLTILAIFVGTGAFRVYELLDECLEHIVPPQLSKHIAFVLVSVMVAAMLAPFLLPVDLSIQVGVWILYLTYFGVGAWRLYDFIVVVRNDLRSKRSKR